MMKTFIYACIVAGIVIAAGCGGGNGGGGDAFDLTVDTITVDGDVSDAIDAFPDMEADGTGITVTAGSFTAVLDNTAQSDHTITATDDVGNVETVTVQVQ